MSAKGTTARAGEQAPRQRRRWWQAVSISGYAARLAVVDFVVWLLLFWLFCGALFYWAAPRGWLGYWLTAALAAWAGFFAGLVGFYSAGLQARRALLLGLVEPEPREWQRLERVPGRSLAFSFWAPAWGWGGLGALAAGGFMLALSQLGEKMDYQRAPYLFYTALVPALVLALVALHSARLGAERFILARRVEEQLTIPMSRYLWLHAIVPYLPVSTAVGVLAAWARFRQPLLLGRSVAAEEVARHLGLTALLLGLVLPAVARLKVRIDRLSPIAIEGRWPRCRWPYSWLVAVGAAVAVFGACHWLGPLLAPGGMSGATVLWLKAGVCLGLGLWLVSWAVRWELCRLQRAGADGHPYLARARRIAEVRRRLGSGHLP